MSDQLQLDISHFHTWKDCISIVSQLAVAPYRQLHVTEFKEPYFGKDKGFLKAKVQEGKFWPRTVIGIKSHGIGADQLAPGEITLIDPQYKDLAQRLKTDLQAACSINYNIRDLNPDVRIVI
jgi:hypothetical protein